ncbi:rhodanese-related sulfurtransferase [Chaetoceros tenuissimus]|uniref:Rhodanese-related sulfurtransferase n=1 Tax=Chaetoceros tenuissimus TaxID=426638 RepID=A0AAD3HDJ1_9STRA|nr:rhodanese-related sulfurtransferase [Chaetoceros tenuissimus]
MSTPATSNKLNGSRHIVLALYKFVKIPSEEIPSLKAQIEEKLRLVKARGTILLAEEGINGTICYAENEAGGPSHDLVKDYLNNHEYFMGIRTRTSYTDTAIFHRLKVKIKKEIVTIGGEIDETDESKKPIGYMSKCEIDPNKMKGTYVKPGKEWDDLCDDPDVVVIDTRNKYEIEIGTFENAINPNTDNFRQFPDWLHRFADKCKEANEEEVPDRCVLNTKSTTEDNARNNNPVPEEDMPIVRKKPKAIAMYCTGGIRCEKSTSYTLAAEVFPKDIPVYHLEGGVLAYLDAHPDEKKSKWKGECFVFDQRVAVTHGLKPSEKYNACHACRRPISTEDMQRDDYVKGVSCRYCKDSANDKSKQRFEMRQKQMDLAQSKGSRHIHDPKELNE